MSEAWQPIATAPTDGRWLWFRRDATDRWTEKLSAFKWDASRDMWFAGLGWWHQIPLAFTHWRLINDQPAEALDAFEEIAEQAIQSFGMLKSEFSCSDQEDAVFDREQAAIESTVARVRAALAEGAVSAAPPAEPKP